MYHTLFCIGRGVLVVQCCRNLGSGDISWGFYGWWLAPVAVYSRPSAVIVVLGVVGSVRELRDAEKKTSGAIKPYWILAPAHGKKTTMMMASESDVSLDSS